jgi:protein-L-isoaspartate(D-aspartate) O-methyltransferase
MPSHFDAESLREMMVREQIEARGIKNPSLLAALRKVPRHFFLPEMLGAEAYADRAISIGPEQSISQPYIVARMLERLAITKSDKVLEIGTGSGYQAALLSELAGHVYSIDIDGDLVKRARFLIERLGYRNITLAQRDGYQGWSEHAPFDAIIVTAAPMDIPRALVSQLSAQGRMILPIGQEDQILLYLERKDGTLESEELERVNFVELKQQSEEPQCS